MSTHDCLKHDRLIRQSGNIGEIIIFSHHRMIGRNKIKSKPKYTYKYNSLKHQTNFSTCHNTAQLVHEYMLLKYYKCFLCTLACNGTRG